MGLEEVLHHHKRLFLLVVYTSNDSSSYADWNTEEVSVSGISKIGDLGLTSAPEIGDVGRSTYYRKVGHILDIVVGQMDSIRFMNRYIIW